MEDVPDRHASHTLHGVREGGGLGRVVDDSTRSKDTWGRIDRTATGTSLGSASRSHDGKTTPACAEPNRRSVCPVSSVPNRCLAPTRERMGCREARHASVCSSRDGGVGVRRSSKDDRAAADRFSITSTERSAKWVSVSTVSVADAGRTHLRPCGSVRESGRDDVETLKRGVEPERDRRNVRGLVARRHSNVSTHAE